MQGKLGSLDLSFDDDAFFAVPDTAAKAPGRTSLDYVNSNLAKGFISDDVRFPQETCVCTESLLADNWVFSLSH